jgi:hypothetical protein
MPHAAAMADPAPADKPAIEREWRRALAEFEPDPPDHPAKEPEPQLDHSRGRIVAIGAIALLLIGGWWLVQKLQRTAAVQDCVIAGHRDCGGADTAPR